MYLGTPINDAERMNKRSGAGVNSRIIVAGHKIKQCQNFLSEAHNYRSFFQFFVGERKLLSNYEILGISGDGCCKLHELFLVMNSLPISFSCWVVV